ANLRRTLLQQIAQQAAQLTASMIADGNYADVEELLELGMTGGDETAVRNYVAFLLLRGRIDEKLPQWKTKAEQPNGQQAAEVLASLYKAKGDLPNARRAAEKSGKRHLLRYILHEQRDWKALLEKAEAQPGMNGRTDIEELGYLAAYRRLAGKADTFEKSVAEIIRFADNPPPGFRNSQHWYSAVALLLNDRSQDAITLLTKSKNYF